MRKVENSSAFRLHFTSDPTHVGRYAIIIFAVNNHHQLKNIKWWLGKFDSNPNITSVGLLGIGSEQCHNKFIESYITSKHHFEIKFMFLVYGVSRSSNVSHPPIFNWPLGPAFYRHFPRPAFDHALAWPYMKKRQYLCNFIGTVYPNSYGRKMAESTLTSSENSHLNCIHALRSKWKAAESNSSRATYLSALKSSDYTLCPPGYNVEAYRIYEAMTFGSVPILQHSVGQVPEEDLQGKDYWCAESFALLKEHNAPVIWIEDWKDIGEVLQMLKAETAEQTFKRRLAVLQWYQRFKAELGAQFIQALHLLF